jgi:hypothetical protein
MKKKLDNALCAKYPKIFVERNLSMMETCMCWGFPGDGWYHLIDGLCALIQHRIDYVNKAADEAEAHNLAIAEGRLEDLSEWARQDPYPRTVPERIYQVVATQVKEKYGGLRFYYNGGDDTIHHWVSFAEFMSERTCETCGKPGEVYTDGWHLTLCKTHAKKTGRSHKDETPQL